MPSLGADILAPTAERYAQGTIERLDRPIADTVGAIARPFRCIDTLKAMERRGSITYSMLIAGEMFREHFAAAHLQQLRSANLLRVGGGKGQPGSNNEAAREKVWRAIVAVGGLASAGGACLWHVVGCEDTLKRWAIEQGWNGRRVTQETASGILIAALGALEAHYAGHRAAAA